MADPVTITCDQACTVTLVHEFAMPPFNLSEADGGAIAAAILAVWAAGWCFRALIRHLRETDGSNPEEEA